MKKAFSTLACPELNFTEVVALAKRSGITAVELRLDRQNRICGLEGAYQMDIVRRLLRENGVSICDLATGISFHDYNPAMVDEMERCAALAKEVGTKALRIFIGASVGKRSEEVVRDYDGIARTLIEGADRVKPYGVELWIETHSNFSTGESLLPLLQMVNRDNVLVLWDVIHSVEWGESLEDTVQAIGQYIVHVHLKDGVKRSDPDRIHYELTALDQGDLDFAATARVLKSIDFNGYLSLEWEKQWHPELAALYADNDALLAAYDKLLEKYFA